MSEGVQLSNFQPLKGWSPQIGIPLYLTLIGVTFEADWINLEVDAGEKVYLFADTSPDKHVIFYQRTLNMSRERGHFRTYGTFDTDFSTIGDTLNIENLRPDTQIPTLTTLQPITAPSNLSEKLADVPLLGISAMGQGQSVGGSMVEDTIVRVGFPGAQVVFEFENLSSTTTFFQATFRWFEMNTKSLPAARNI